MNHLLKFRNWKLEITFFTLILFLLIAKNAEAATINKSPNYLFSTSGLVGYWTMDGNNVNWATGAVTDSSGRGNTGTITNMATFTGVAIGKIGQALNFDGVNDRVLIGRMASTFEGVSAFSISTWVKINTLTSFASFVSKSHTSNDINFIHFGIVRSNEDAGINDVSIYFNSNGPRAYTTSNILQTNIWYHMVLVYDGTQTGNSGRIKIYVNSVNQSLDFTGTFGTTSPTETRNVNIGSTDAPASFLNGVEDDVRVYNRALSANEIATLFNSGVAKFNVSPTKYLTSGLVGYWTMDGSKVNWATGAVTDSSGKGNTGTVTNMSTSTAQAIGKVGQALSFDGVNDYVVTSAINLSSTNAVSVSLWLLKPSYANDDQLAIEATTNQNNFTTGFIIDPNSSSSGGGFFEINTRGDVGNNAALYTRPSAGAWHHYVAIFDKSQSTNESNLYIDGVLQTATSRPNTSNNTNNFGNDAWYFMSRGGASLFSTGTLDEVRIYNRALGANEVATLFNSGAAKFNVSPTKYLTTGLVGYWTMDGSKVNWKTGAVTDSSGQGNTGFVTLMATSTGVAIGKVGQALNFDGVNDFVNVSNTIGGIQTVGFWVKVATSSQKIIDLNGTASIEVISNTITANSFTSPTIYVDGVAVSTIDNNWHYVTVTTGTGISGSAITIGKVGGSLNGVLDDVRIYNRALSASEISRLYNIGR